MSAENNGLRFDIYERVNLPENVAAIEELEEIELVPRIQVIDQGEVVLLQGQLVLNGIYRGEGFGQEQIALEHWIPVEISLPMNRVQQLDEITVDIDTFQVEPVSERALNITGVLALRGLYLEEQEQQWNQQEEYGELSFVAEARAQDEQGAESWTEQSVQEEENRENWFAPDEQAQLEAEQLSNQWRDLSEEAVANAEEQAESQQEANWQEAQSEEQAELAYREAEQVLLEAEAEQLEEQQPEEQLAYREEAVEVAEDEQAYDQEQAAYYADSDYTAQAQEEDLAAWQASEPEAAKVTTSFGIKDILSSSLREQAASELQRLDAERERIAKQLLQEQSQAEPIEWRHMLLQADGKEQFRKIKMYIVQKNDTLELIAGKYAINPRDLLNHNKLSETSISEGQLLYIP